MGLACVRGGRWVFDSVDFAVAPGSDRLFLLVQLDRVPLVPLGQPAVGPAERFVEVAEVAGVGL